MAELDHTLPLLPLTQGWCLPGMVVTMALETDEARAAADAAGRPTASSCSCPVVDGRYARVGTSPDRGGRPAAGRHPGPRGPRRGSGRPSAPAFPAPARPCGSRSIRSSRPPATPEVDRTRPRVPRRGREHPGRQGRGPHHRDCSATITDPSALADIVRLLARPDLRAEGRGARDTSTSRPGCARCSAGLATSLADLSLRERIKTDVEEGMEKTQREFLLRRQIDAIKKELGELERPVRRRRTRRLPAPAGRTAERDLPDAREHRHRAGDRQARADQRAEPRARLDPHVARHGARDSRGVSAHEDRLDVAEGCPHPRRGSRRPHRRQRADPRAPRRAQAARRTGPGPGDAGAVPAPSWPWSVRRASARPRWANRWPAPSDASSCGSPSAACATRPRSVATAVPTSVRSRDGWCGPCGRRGR